MRRFFGLAVSVYLIAALRGLAKEAKGDLRCECNGDCWCRKPGLSLFRWVFPAGHSIDPKVDH